MCGLGKYQILHFFTVVLGMLSGVFILYSMVYLELNPKYKCKYHTDDQWAECFKEDICND